MKYIICLLVMLAMIGTVIWHHLCNQVLIHYTQQENTKPLKEIGINNTQFIGLHVKTLKEDIKTLYVRKTTPYIGLILFMPDLHYDFHFYLPWLYQIAKKGYLIVTYTSQATFSTTMHQELDNILKVISEDEVLSTYPLSLLGHKSGAQSLLFLDAKYTNIQKIVALAPTTLDAIKLCEYAKTQLPANIKYFKKHLLHLFQKQIKATPPEVIPTLDKRFLVISAHSLGDQEEGIVQIEKNRHDFPFLQSATEVRLENLITYLENPTLPLFDYHKAIDDFDLSQLYQLDPELFEKILTFLSA